MFSTKPSHMAAFKMTTVVFLTLVLLEVSLPGDDRLTLLGRNLCFRVQCVGADI